MLESALVLIVGRCAKRAFSLLSAAWPRADTPLSDTRRAGIGQERRMNRRPCLLMPLLQFDMLNLAGQNYGLTPARILGKELQTGPNITLAIGAASCGTNKACRGVIEPLIDIKQGQLLCAQGLHLLHETDQGSPVPGR